MHWLQHTFRTYPEIAVFLTLALGFFVGKLHIGKFSLGTITSVLLAGILEPPISGAHVYAINNDPMGLSIKEYLYGE